MEQRHGWPIEKLWTLSHLSDLRHLLLRAHLPDVDNPLEHASISYPLPPSLTRLLVEGATLPRASLSSLPAYYRCVWFIPIVL